MKIKLKAPGAADAPPQSPSSEAPKLPGLKLKFKPPGRAPAESVDSQRSAEALQQKRKHSKKPSEGGIPHPPAISAPKKRPREDGEEGDPPAKRKLKPTAKSLAMADESDDEDDPAGPAPPAPRPAPARTQSIKLSIKPKTGLQRTGTALLKVKGAGRKPVRPFGVGYDSEAEEAEDDPAIESQFVLRMLPGPDCDLLRKSIEEKTIGKSVTQGGPGVYFRFFDREGRRAMVTIQGRSYAASMVELPSVIESMKSWNKKDWVKTADVCQMLLVLGPVQSEDEAKKYPRPSYVDLESHRFPHGLTPPMRWARKRRFRPRKSYLDVERAETQMNELLAADENAESSKYDLIDSEHDSTDAESSSEEDEEDEEMATASQIAQTPVEEVDAVDLEQMFMEDDDMEIQGNPEDLNALFGGGDNNALFGDGNSVTINVGTAATAHDVAMHALNQNSNIALEIDTAASTPAAATSADDDDDDDDAESDDDEVDEAAAAEEARKEQLRAEIAELDKAIQQSIEARDRQNNHIFKKRMQITIDKQVVDRDIKRKQLGEDPDD